MLVTALGCPLDLSARRGSRPSRRSIPRKPNLTQDPGFAFHSPLSYPHIPALLCCHAWSRWPSPDGPDIAPWSHRALSPSASYSSATLSGAPQNPPVVALTLALERHPFLSVSHFLSCLCLWSPTWFPRVLPLLRFALTFGHFVLSRCTRGSHACFAPASKASLALSFVLALPMVL